ncbi:hypothetical protein HKCCE4037_07965 [Rhodobacterales bacterium HKCCE4037]|nr:hypothetical protein [Rhodobacterales bacterium HKCCE4037]
MFCHNLTLLRHVQRFCKTESGAFTVDWVVLVAGLVGLTFAVMIVVSGGVENGSNDLSQSLANAEPSDDPFLNNTDLSSPDDIVIE